MADPATKLLAVYVNAFSPQIVLKKRCLSPENTPISSSMLG